MKLTLEVESPTYLRLAQDPKLNFVFMIVCSCSKKGRAHLLYTPYSANQGSLFAQQERTFYLVPDC